MWQTVKGWNTQDHTTILELEAASQFISVTFPTGILHYSNSPRRTQNIYSIVNCFWKTVRTIV